MPSFRPPAGNIKSSCVLGLAADIDLDAAYYLEQTNHVTNATAWMITGEDQVGWILVRDNTCRTGPDPLKCRIRMTRERTHLIISRHPVPHQKRT